jgi:hypothetical protein
MIHRPLGVVTEIVESLGLGISYAYDDLVFLDHPDFLLQFTDSAQEVLIHINEDAGKEKLADMLTTIQSEAATKSILFKTGNYFRASQAGEETVTLEFLTTYENIVK